MYKPSLYIRVNRNLRPFNIFDIRISVNLAPLLCTWLYIIVEPMFDLEFGCHYTYSLCNLGPHPFRESGTSTIYMSKHVLNLEPSLYIWVNRNLRPFNIFEIRISVNLAPPLCTWLYINVEPLFVLGFGTRDLVSPMFQIPDHVCIPAARIHPLIYIVLT